MANMLFANNCNTTLNGGITAVATSMVVTSATGFPAPTGSQYFYCTLADAATQTTIEIVKVTAVSGTTFTIVRGQDGTTGTIFASGAVVSLRLVAASLNDFPKLDEANTFTGDITAPNILTTGHIGINTATVPTILMRAVGDNNSLSRIAMRGYSSDANSSSIRVSKFRGTVAAPQAPISGDSLGKFELAGYGTTSADAYPQVSLEGVTTEVWGATARGAKAVVKVTPNTTTTQVTALTIDQDSKATFASTVTANGVLLTGNTGTVTSVAALTLGTTGTDLSSTVATGTTTPVITLNVPTASATNRGALSAADWTTFNNKGSGTVTSVTGTAPVVSSGGTTPAISMAAATTSVNGYLTSTDWTTFNGKQAALVSGTNIKTVNGTSLLGSGDVGTIDVAHGGTGLTTLTAGYIPYGNGTSAFSSSSTLFFDGANLGVGTSSPNTGFGKSFVLYNSQNTGTVASNSFALIQSLNRNAVVELCGSSTAANAFNFSTTPGTAVAGVVGDIANQALAFRTGGTTERMRIFSSGGVSIGNTTDPGAGNLSVNGTVGIGTANQSNLLGIRSTTANLRAISLYNANGNTGDYLAIGCQTDYNNTYSGSEIRFYNELPALGRGGLGFATGTSTQTTRVYISQAGDMYPYVDNSYSLGVSSARWTAVWAANGTIQTSDANTKTDIVDSPLGLNFIASLRPVAYKFKIGKNIVEERKHEDDPIVITPVAGKRQHFGLIAQEVKSSLPNNIDFGGWIQTDTSDENSEQGLRYDEFISPMIKAIQELKQQFDAYVASHP